MKDAVGKHVSIMAQETVEHRHKTKHTVIYLGYARKPKQKFFHLIYFCGIHESRRIVKLMPLFLLLLFLKNELFKS